MSFFSRWTKGGKPPPPDDPTDAPTAPTEAAPTIASSPPSAPEPSRQPQQGPQQGPHRTRTEPMMTAVDRRPPPPPPKVTPREDLNATKKSGPDVLVSRVVEISTSPPPLPPPPARRPEIAVDMFAPPPREPQATVDWSPQVTTDTKPNLGAAAREAQQSPLAASVAADAIPPPPPSVRGRPMAPSFDPPGARGPFTTDSVESLLDDVDAGFDNILEDAPSTSRDLQPAKEGALAKSPSGGLSDARALFMQLAAGHVRHVRDFMIDVTAGQAKTEWVSVCQPAIRSLHEMSQQLQMTEVGVALDGFGQALLAAGQAAALVVEGDLRQRLVDAYQPLLMAMPSAFALDDARSAREGIIVQALLQQIPEIKKVALDKLFAAGLTSLGVFYVAKAEEITVTTGISTDVARKVLERFKRYKDEVESTKVDAGRTAEHARLAQLCAEMRERHVAFERAEAEGDSKGKREERKAREEAFLEVKVLLARLGETDRIAAMEKLPFAQKVSELQGYLDEARMRARKS